MTTVNDILLRVRRKIDDMQKIKISDTELIQSLNEAIDSVSMELISSLEPLMIRSLTVSGSNKVSRPANFIKFVGQYPLKYINDSTGAVFLQHLDSEFYGTLNARYYATMPKVSNLSDNIPFEKTEHQLLLVERTAGMFVQSNQSIK